MTSKQDVLEALKEAEGPSDWLNAAVKCATLAPAGAYVEQSPFNGKWCVYDGTRDRSGRARLFAYRDVPPVLKNGDVTASLDACLALLKQVLPGWFGEISTIACATVAKPGIKRPAFHGDADTPALALCIAIVEALIAQEQETEHD